jgi:hypothetical protein
VRALRIRIAKVLQDREQQDRRSGGWNAGRRRELGEREPEGLGGKGVPGTADTRKGQPSADRECGVAGAGGIAGDQFAGVAEALARSWGYSASSGSPWRASPEPLCVIMPGRSHCHMNAYAPYDASAFGGQAPAAAPASRSPSAAKTSSVRAICASGMPSAATPRPLPGNQPSGSSSIAIPLISRLVPYS